MAPGLDPWCSLQKSQPHGRVWRLPLPHVACIGPPPRNDIDSTGLCLTEAPVGRSCPLVAARCNCVQGSQRGAQLVADFQVANQPISGQSIVHLATFSPCKCTKCSLPRTVAIWQLQTSHRCCFLFPRTGGLRVTSLLPTASDPLLQISSCISLSPQDLRPTV